MHPLNRLFEEIYRNHWGMTLADRSRRQGEVPTWQKTRRAADRHG